jgi:hypothetical protein
MAYAKKQTNIINLAAKMNSRQNNESMNIDPNTTSMEMVSLTNADLFHTQALAARLGVDDISNGIVNASGGSSIIVQTADNSASGTAESTVTITNQQPNVIFDYAGMFIIPTGNGQNLFTGTFYHSSTLSASAYSALGSEIDYELKFKAWVYPMDQATLPSSGTSWMSGTTAPRRIPHDIGLSGNYNVAPYPQITIASASLNSSTPVAISVPITFTPGPYTWDGSNYVTATGTFDVVFSAPYEMNTGTVYWIKPLIENTSGTSNRSIELTYVQNGATDISPNTLMAQEFLYIGAPANQSYAVRKFAPEKSWFKTNIYEYQSPSYLLVDNGTANRTITVPIVSGSFISAPNFVANVQTGVVTGLSYQPLSRTTKSPEFGEVIHIPSGTWTIYGSYFFANTYTGLSNQGAALNNWTRNAVPFPSTDYNAGYFGYFSSIDSSSGAITGSNYKINNRTILAEFSGNHVFSNPIDYPLNPTNGPVYNLDKIYALYNNPVTIATTGADYLLSFKFYDFTSGGDMTDYVDYNVGNTFTYTVTPFQIAVNQTTNGSGAFVYNWSGNDTNFNQYNDNGAAGGNDRDLTCGLIYIPSGNAITSIYDYRVGDSRTQKVIYTQRDEVRAFDLYNPNAPTVLFTGAAIDNDNKWSHSTFQNLLFSHQYSQTSGVCWDQIFSSNVTGNSMQPHGLRPEFYSNEISYTGTGDSLASGTITSIMMATQLFSGGLRASKIKDIQISSNAQAIVELTGTDIFNGNLYPTGSQYAFDPVPQSTYVFATENSGVTFYLAQLFTGTSVYSLSETNNPISNTGTFPVYIRNISGPVSTGSIVLTQQIPNVIVNPQEYLVNQVDVPKFKKTIVWKNILWGIGDPDNPSRLWYSEIQAPNIFGVDTNYFGYIDIDNDNGQELTGIEVFKDYLIIFKQNSTYRGTFTSNPALPIDIFKLSSTIGNLGIFTTVSTDYGIFGLSQYGPILASYAGVDTVGDEILPTYQDFDHNDLIFAVAIHDRARQQIYWSIC